MKIIRSTLIVALVGLLAVSASAITFTMDQLTANGGQHAVTIGGVTFNDWGFSGPLAASDVSVTATKIGDLSYQVSFGGAFVDGYSATSPGASDFRLFYSVETAPGDPLLAAIDQSFNMTVQGAGGIIGIGETVFANANHTGDPVAQSSVGFVYGQSDLADPSAEAEQGDQLLIDPGLSKVWVTKDISLYAAPDGYVGATIIYQGISQAGGTPRSGVPDGANTLGLLGVALTGLAGLRRLLGC